MTVGSYGSDGYGIAFYGSLPPQIGVAFAAAINGTHVQVVFTETLDPTFSTILLPSNYLIAPSLTVLSVEIVSGNEVILTTSPQTNILYTVTVVAARSLYNTFLNPLQNSATFTGFPLGLGYFALATSSTRVRAVFTTTMLNDANLSNPANYSITDFSGNALTLVSAEPEQSIHPVSVLLTLSAPLNEGSFYVCNVFSNIHTETGLNVLPPTSVFQWIATVKQVSVPLSRFTGEVMGPPFGNPAGLVYFSPALNVDTPNSIIQIEEVSVCTTAYDTYCPPKSQGTAKVPLFTFSLNEPSPDPYLLNQCVLWAPFPKLSDVMLDLADTEEDFFQPPVDTSCSILMKQQYALGYVSLLNDPAWYIFDNKHGTSVPPTFILANNLSPIPPGPETIMVLHVQMSGSSRFGPSAAKKIGHTSASMSGSSQLFAGSGPPPVVLAQASISGGASLTANIRERLRGAANIQGTSFVRALAQEGGALPTVLFGVSYFQAFATVSRSVASAIAGGSHVVSTGSIRRGVQASVQASSEVEGVLTARWAGKTSIHGVASVYADAAVIHKVEAFPVGSAEVTATAT